MSHNGIESLLDFKKVAIAASGELVQIGKGEETDLLQVHRLADFLANTEHPSFVLPVLRNTVCNDTVTWRSPIVIKLKIGVAAQELLSVTRSKGAVNHVALTRICDFCLLLAQFTELEMSRKTEPHKLW
jgi:hypothetical protein